jgi:hypothetical protein
MKKSTYSVVLSDRVVAEIDRLAYRKGTNRSNLINEILAEYVSLTTPEQRISRIFSDMAALLYPGEVFRELAPPTPSVMSIRSALTYKYNPTVRYTVELFRDPGAVPGGSQGIIRVSVRTTSEPLLYELRRFYRLWAETERKFGFPGKSAVEDNVFRRPILHRLSPAARDTQKSEAEEKAGAVLAAYVSLMDSGMKLCFREPEDEKAAGLLSDLYSAYLSEHREIV